MLVELAIAIIGGVAAVTCSSLWFCSVIDKRDRAGRDAPALTVDALQPFVRITLATRCPFCKDGGEQKRGPDVPKACSARDRCRFGKVAHTHVRCQSCDARWAMKAAQVQDVNEASE